ncbi:hypothetical protein T08_12667 [Trichinella sp. T8]|nr:hypothetical protein T08_12667 [Trichinella sp. T8]
MDPSGKDMVQAIQSDDFKFYESQVEIIKNCFTIQQPYHSDVNDLNAVSTNADQSHEQLVSIANVP